MEYQFENVGTPNVHAAAEVHYRMNIKRIGIWVVVYLLLGAYFLREYLLGYSYLFTPVIIFGCAICMALLPYFQVRKNLKKKTAFHDGKLPENIARFGEVIRIENAIASRTWEYDHLVKVCSYRYSYCLIFADQTVLFMYRDGFTKGTFEEFKQFLRTRRPDLKIPD